MNSNASSRPQSKLTIRTMVTIALITAITCVLAPISIPIPVSPVPITLGNLVLFISIYVLGCRNALISFIIYLLLGLVGLPVFSGFSGGIGKVLGPTGGYLIGFFFMILIAGFFIDRFPSNRIFHVAGMALSSVALYIFGTLWLARQMDLTFVAALSVGVIPYIAGDAIKIIVAAIVGSALKSRLNKVQ